MFDMIWVEYITIKALTDAMRNVLEPIMGGNSIRPLEIPRWDNALGTTESRIKSNLP